MAATTGTTKDVDTGGMDVAGRMQVMAQALKEEASTMRLIQDIIHAFMSDEQDLEATIAFCLQRVCNVQGWSVGHGALLHADAAESASVRHVWHLSDPDREEPFRRASEQMRYDGPAPWMPGILHPDEIRVMPDLAEEAGFARGQVAHGAGLKSGVILPIRLEEQVPAYLEFYATEPIDSAPAMLDLMACISSLMSQLVQRQLLDKAVSDSIWFMQRRVGRELHDSVCQDLVGLAFLGRQLLAALRRDDSSQVEAGRELVAGIEATLSRARAISKGLTPIECEADELPRALGDLVKSTRDRFGIDFALECPDELLLASDEQARHMYFIAHEGITNAVKHSEASRVRVELAQRPGRVVLRIRDDGVGLVCEQETSSGIGMRVMRYRADAIGAKLSIEADPDGGTVLTCTLPRKDLSK